MTKPRRTTAMAAVTVGALLLAGCTMAPRFQTPELPVSETWRTDALSPERTVSAELAAAEIAWQSFFRSAGLRRVIDTALENNRDLQIAALNVAAARELYRIERSDILPNISAGVAGTRQQLTDAQVAGSANPTASQGYITSTYTANLASTAFELDLFGRLRSQNKAALETYFATRSARDAAQISLIAEVANAYLQWLADRKILVLTEETLAAQEKSYGLIAKSQEKGVASKLDVAQVRQAVETARAARALYTRRVMQDRNALLLLMGIKTFDPILQADQLDDIELMETLPTDLPSDVLLARPDVRQAEHELRSSNANIGAARAAFFPTISLTGSFGYASSSLDNLFSGAASGGWTFAPQITAPIFQAGRNRANLEYSWVVKDASVAQYEKTLQTAFKEVADELAALSTLDDELKAQRRLVNATRQAYNLSYARYKEGIDSFLNVLDAQRTLFTAEQQAIEIEKQRLSNLVNLYKVLGGGTKSAADEAASPSEPAGK